MRPNFFVFALVLIILASSSFSSGQAILGVSPAELSFTKVLRGGYAQRPITVTLDSMVPVNVSLSTRGNISTWINTSVKSFLVSKDKIARVAVSIIPPSDMPNGNYTGVLSLESESLPSSAVSGHATGRIRSVLDVVIRVEITDTEVKSCQANQFEVESAEKGDDLIFKVNVANQGNVRLKPEVVLSIWDQEQTNLLKTVSLMGDEVLPTHEQFLTFRVPTASFPIGQYWADFAVVDCFASETETFDVYEPGTLKAAGTLLRISSFPLLRVGDTSSIEALFKNHGEKEVMAQFRGKISKEGNIVQLLESEKIRVPIGKIENFTFYFTPRSSGRYVVSGRVFYDTKRTFEASTVISVASSGTIWKNISSYILYGLIIIVAAILFFYIRRERRKHMEIMRSFNVRHRR